MQICGPGFWGRLVYMAFAILLVAVPVWARGALAPPPEPVCGAELLANGGFEEPIVDNPQGWDIFAPADHEGMGWQAAWVDEGELPGKPSAAVLELHLGGAAVGDQYIELDADFDGVATDGGVEEPASTTIYQDLATSAGTVYQISFYTSPRPGSGSEENKVVFSWDGAQVETVVEDGSASADTSWTRHDYSLTASGDVTRIAFSDGGVSNSIGSLLDDVSVKTACPAAEIAEESAEKPADEEVPAGPVSCAVSGSVWEDADGDSVKDTGEPVLSGWTVYVDTDDNGSLDANEPSVVAGVDGGYAFTELAVGTYHIRQALQSGWQQTFPSSLALHRHEAVCSDAANIIDLHFGNQIIPQTAATVNSGAPDAALDENSQGGAAVSPGAVIIPQKFLSMPEIIPTMLTLPIAPAQFADSQTGPQIQPPPSDVGAIATTARKNQAGGRAVVLPPVVASSPAVTPPAPTPAAPTQLPDSQAGSQQEVSGGRVLGETIVLDTDHSHSAMPSTRPTGIWQEVKFYIIFSLLILVLVLLLVLFLLFIADRWRKRQRAWRRRRIRVVSSIGRQVVIYLTSYT